MKQPKRIQIEIPQLRRPVATCIFCKGEISKGDPQAKGKTPRYHQRCLDRVVA